MARQLPPKQISGYDSFDDDEDWLNEFGETEEKRFILVGKPNVIQSSGRPIREKHPSTSYLAICADAQTFSGQCSDCVIRSADFYNRGWKAGMLYAEELVKQALKSACREINSSATTSSSEPDKKRAEKEHVEIVKPKSFKRRAVDVEENGMPSKKLLPSKRIAYTDEDDEKLKKLAKEIIQKSPGISDNALNKKVHAECGLDRSFGSIESHMKRFIKPVLFDQDDSS
uniref:Uncharacterized protein n=1 Tax=Panagrolaimus sp. ES5 TaxID=591445 RepID=A0AC34F843_9BILA